MLDIFPPVATARIVCSNKLAEPPTHWSQIPERREAFLAEVAAIIAEAAAKRRASWAGRDSLRVIHGAHGRLSPSRAKLHLVVERKP